MDAEPELSIEQFRSWLDRYGAAWEARDPAAAAALFTADARYYWTPFGDPKAGPGGIAEAWSEATSRQREVRVRLEALAVTNRTGIAHWHTVFDRPATGRRVELDGVLTAELALDLRCRLFREWWHSTESEGT